MRMVLREASIALFLLSIGQVVFAEEFPTKTCRIVAPFQTGGAGSLLAQVVAGGLSQRWGKPVIVENRPGAGTMIGTKLVAHAAADGHTLLLVPGAFVINTRLRPSMPYDAFKDFAPVTQLTSSPMLLVVNLSSPAKSLRDLLEEARTRPGQLSYATPGSGTNQHLLGEMLKIAAKVDLVDVAYPGGAPAVTALLGNHVHAVIANYAEVANHIAAGKLRALAVSWPERLKRLPEVPTFSESGFKDIQLTIWYGIVAPAGTPPKTIARIQSDIASVLKMPAVQAKLAAQELHSVGSTPEEFGSYMRALSAEYGDVIRAAGIKAE